MQDIDQPLQIPAGEQEPDLRVLLPCKTKFIDVLIDLTERAQNGKILSADFLSKVLRYLRVPKCERAHYELHHCGRAISSLCQVKEGAVLEIINSN